MLFYLNIILAVLNIFNFVFSGEKVFILMVVLNITAAYTIKRLHEEVTRE